MHLICPLGVKEFGKRVCFVDCSSRRMDPFESWPTWMNSVYWYYFHIWGLSQFLVIQKVSEDFVLYIPYFKLQITLGGALVKI